jgi:DGQHR domain-containing protein
MIIEKTASKVVQGSLVIYTTSLKVSDLMVPNFYKVDKLDASGTNSGFQRVLDKTRARRLAKYVLDAWDDGDAFLPTSIFLATDRGIEYDPQSSKIKFDTSAVCPFNVVDGQHRVEGLLEAARENSEIQDFEICANVAVNLDEISQMCHFLIVNTTQKSVDKAVEQQIVARLSGMIDLEDVPTLPKWIQKQVLKGEDKEALIITNYLNNDPESPWHRKIRMANEGRDDNNTINQHSFVQAIKTYILSSSNPVAAISDIDRRNRILKNYWRAVADLLVDPDAVVGSVVFKTIGLELFCIVSQTVFTRLFANGDFRVETIKSALKQGFDNLPNDYLGVQHAEWWQSGGGASNLNKQAVRQIATELNKAMNARARSDEIQL